MLEIGCDDDALLTVHDIPFLSLSLPLSLSLFCFFFFRWMAPPAVVIHGVPDLTTPEEHEWWCPFGVQVEIVMLPDANASRKSSSSSRKRCKN